MSNQPEWLLLYKGMDHKRKLSGNDIWDIIEDKYSIASPQNTNRSNDYRKNANSADSSNSSNSSRLSPYQILKQFVDQYPSPLVATYLMVIFNFHNENGMVYRGMEDKDLWMHSILTTNNETNNPSTTISKILRALIRIVPPTVRYRWVAGAKKYEQSIFTAFERIRHVYFKQALNNLNESVLSIMPNDINAIIVQYADITLSLCEKDFSYVLMDPIHWQVDDMRHFMQLIGVPRVLVDLLEQSPLNNDCGNLYTIEKDSYSLQSQRLAHLLTQKRKLINKALNDKRQRVFELTQKYEEMKIKRLEARRRQCDDYKMQFAESQTAMETEQESLQRGQKLLADLPQTPTNFEIQKFLSYLWFFAQSAKRAN